MFENGEDDNLEFNIDDFDDEGEKSPSEDKQEPQTSDPEIIDEAKGKPEDATPEDDNKAPEQDALINQYKNEDGTLNQDAFNQLLQEKTDLEQKAQIVEQLQNEREDFAKNLGYENYEKMQMHQKKLMSDMQFAKYEANEYARYLQYSSNPEAARALLIQYAQNPTVELQSQIESEFDINVIKKVNQDLEKFKLDVEQQNKKEEYELHQKEAKEFITDAVTRYKEKFENEPFKELFSECVKIAGNRFVMDELVRMVSAIEENAVKKHIAQQASLKENNSAIQNLQNSTPQSKKVESGTSNPDIGKMSSSEIDTLVQDLI